jgi:hypothetical protein
MWYNSENGQPSGWITNDIPAAGKVRSIIRGGNGW